MASTSYCIHTSGVGHILKSAHRRSVSHRIPVLRSYALELRVINDVLSSVQFRYPNSCHVLFLSPFVLLRVGRSYGGDGGRFGDRGPRRDGGRDDYRGGKKVRCVVIAKWRSLLSLFIGLGEVREGWRREPIQVEFTNLRLVPARKMHVVC